MWILKRRNQPPTTQDEVGYGSYKKKGRKRHIATDTLGLVIAVFLTAASTHDRDGVEPLMQEVARGYEAKRVKRVFADKGYRGQHHRVKNVFPDAELMLVGKQEGQVGFVVQKKQTVERSFAWMKNSRRLGLDYERTIKSAEAQVRISAIRHCLRLLA